VRFVEKRVHCLHEKPKNRVRADERGNRFVRLDTKILSSKPMPEIMNKSSSR
jgi:hypothetical protein